MLLDDGLKFVDNTIRNGRIQFPHENPRHWDVINHSLTSVDASLEQVFSCIHKSTFIETTVKADEIDSDFEMKQFAESVFHSNVDDLMNVVSQNANHEETINYIKQLTVMSPDVLKECKLSYSEQPYLIQLSRLQCACILANSFFGTFERATDERAWNEMKVPSINMNDLFHAKVPNRSVRVQKIHMILNYFELLKDQHNNNNSEFLQEKVSFLRQVVGNTGSDFPDFANSTKPMITLDVKLNGSIEDSVLCSKVDFANEFIGGAALSYGCAQEEIAFVVHPELIVARLIFQKMSAGDSIIVSGVKRYSNYSGYRFSLQYDGPSDITQPASEWIAIDAIEAQRYGKTDQWRKKLIDRELIKSYSGFHVDHSLSWNERDVSDRIATGSWGCGEFKGDPLLKAIIQWLSASESGKHELVYYTWNNEFVYNQLNAMLTIVTNRRDTANEITVGSLYRALVGVIDLHVEKMDQFDRTNNDNNTRSKQERKARFLPFVTNLRIPVDSASNTIPDTLALLTKLLRE